MFREWLLVGRRLHEDILPVEAQPFIGDLSRVDFNWTEALHRIYKQLVIVVNIVKPQEAGICACWNTHPLDSHGGVNSDP